MRKTLTLLVVVVVLALGAGAIAAEDTDSWQGSTTSGELVHNESDGFDDATVEDLELTSEGYELDSDDDAEESVDASEFGVEQEIETGDELTLEHNPDLLVEEIEAAIWIANDDDSTDSQVSTSWESDDIETEGGVTFSYDGAFQSTERETVADTDFDEQIVGNIELDFEVTGTFNTDGQEFRSLTYYGEQLADNASYQHSHDVEQANFAYVDLDVDKMDAAITWEGYDNGWQEIDSTQTDESGVQSTSFSPDNDYDEIRVTVDADRDEDADEWDITILEEGVEFVNDAPEISDPEPEEGEIVSGDPVEVRVDIDDDQFEQAQGDSVEVVIEDGDGDELETETLEDAGTVSTDYDGPMTGTNEWQATATDKYGGETTTGTLSFSIPDELEIRDEKTNELIEEADGEEVEVRFFPDDPDNEEVETRTTDDGIVDFADLPGDEAFIVTISADGYFTRSTYIDSILEQQTAYLLDDDADASLKTFSLDDRTDNFQSTDSRLSIQKPIQDGNSTSYKTIAGEYFGANGEQSVQLENGERYRLIVENRDGQSRTLGDFTPETDDFVTLDIGRVDIGSPGEAGYNINARTETLDDDEAASVGYEQEIVLSFVDIDETTEQLRYRVVDRNDEDNVLLDWVSINDPTELQETIPVDDDDEQTQWMLEYELDRDGETIENRIPVGGVASPDWPLSAGWLQAFGLFTVVGVAALFGGSMSRTGGVMVAITGFAMTILGVLSIPYPMLLLAGFAAVVFKFAERGDGMYQ